MASSPAQKRHFNLEMFVNSLISLYKSADNKQYHVSIGGIWYLMRRHFFLSMMKHSLELGTLINTGLAVGHSACK